jgi:hypothetical protein
MVPFSAFHVDFRYSGYDYSRAKNVLLTVSYRTLYHFKRHVWFKLIKLMEVSQL